MYARCYIVLNTSPYSFEKGRRVLEERRKGSVGTGTSTHACTLFNPQTTSIGGFALLNGVIVNVMSVVVGANLDDLARVVETHYVDMFVHEFLAYSAQHLSAGFLGSAAKFSLPFFLLFPILKRKYKRSKH